MAKFISGAGNTRTTRVSAARVASCVALVALAACIRLAVYVLAFDAAADSPDAEVLFFNTSDSRRLVAASLEQDLKRGVPQQSIRLGGERPVPDYLFVMWRVKSTGRIYQDTDDLRHRLPRDLNDHVIYFIVNGPQLYVYLVSPKAAPPDAAVVGPARYRGRLVTTIYPESASAKEAPSSVAAYLGCASASKPAQGQNLPEPLSGRLTSTSGVHHVAIRSASCVEVGPGTYQVELTGDASGPAPFFFSAASSPNNGVGSGATWCASWSCSTSADGLRNQNICKHNPGEPTSTYWSSKNTFVSQSKEPPSIGYAVAYEAMPDGNTFVERAEHRVALLCGR